MENHEAKGRVEINSKLGPQGHDIHLAIQVVTPPTGFVVGLNRTGKSCRLRWVNYLHPGLKRGRMTPHEEQLVVELHSRWGNRWSRIARKLPGRTDNEIKNYWRTRMRKNAQERKQAPSPISSSASRCHSSSASNPTTTVVEDSSSQEVGNLKVEMKSTSGHGDLSLQGEESSVEQDEKGNFLDLSMQGEESSVEQDEKGHFMEQFWKEIGSSDLLYCPVDECSMNQGCNFSCTSILSPAWNYYYDCTWKEEEDLKLWVSMDDPLFPTS